MVILGFFLVSAGVATLIATTQLIGSVGNAPAAMPLQDTIQTWLIDVGVPDCPPQCDGSVRAHSLGVHLHDSFCTVYALLRSTATLVQLQRLFAKFSGPH